MIRFLVLSFLSDLSDYVVVLISCFFFPRERERKETERENFMRSVDIIKVNHPINVVFQYYFFIFFNFDLNDRKEKYESQGNNRNATRIRKWNEMK